MNAGTIIRLISYRLQSAMVAFSVLTNAMFDTNNAMVVRRIYTDKSPSTVGRLAPYVTDTCEVNVVRGASCVLGDVTLTVGSVLNDVVSKWSLSRTADSAVKKGVIVTQHAKLRFSKRRKCSCQFYSRFR